MEDCVSVYAIKNGNHIVGWIKDYYVESEDIVFEFESGFGKFYVINSESLRNHQFEVDEKEYDENSQDWSCDQFIESLNRNKYAHGACTLWTADDARYDVIFQNGEIHVVNVKNDETVFRTSYTCVAWERTVIDREIVDRGG